MPTTIIIVQPLQRNISRRQHELQDAEIRAHAARVSHPSNRRQRPFQRSKPRRVDKDDHGLISFHISSWEHEESLQRLPAPSMLLGQGKHDPFKSGQTGELPTALLRSLDYAFEVIWPKNTPFLQGPALERAIQHWRVQAIQSDLEAHAQICAAASLGLALTQDPATARILTLARTTHQLKAFRLIRKTIDSLSGPPSSDLLSAINQISVSGEGDLGPILTDGFPKSPMYSAFNSELYERFSPIATDHHYRAIAVLIKQRGGLDALPPGAAHSILL